MIALQIDSYSSVYCLQKVELSLNMNMKLIKLYDNINIEYHHTMTNHVNIFF